jgi:F420H(2)-dependent quinone reductase
VPIIIVTIMGTKSGKVCKIALVRVEDQGRYGLVASMGGAPNNPGWFHNLVADPNIMIQDGPKPPDFAVRERDEWWGRSVSVFAVRRVSRQDSPNDSGFHCRTAGAVNTARNR